MKKFHFAIMAILVMSISTVVFAQENPREKGFEAITKEAVQGQLQFLASDWTQGRATGMPGEYLAADYIASMFKIYGFEPGGGVVETKISWREEMEGKKPEKYRIFFQNID